MDTQGAGRITGTGGFNCPTACQVTLAEGASVTLTAQPSTGSTFDHWTGVCAGQASTCAFAVTQPTQVLAIFLTPSAKRPVVTLNPAGAGSIVLSSASASIDCFETCAQEVAVGELVTLTARPAAQALFSQWSGACAGAQPTCTLSPSTDVSVTATFKDKPLSAVSVGFNNGAQGTIEIHHGSEVLPCLPPSCGYEFPVDDEVVLHAGETDGWVFTGWFGFGSACGVGDCVFLAGHDPDSPDGEVSGVANFLRLTLSRTTVDLRRPDADGVVMMMVEGIVPGAAGWEAESNSDVLGLSGTSGSFGDTPQPLSIVIVDPDNLRDGTITGAITMRLLDGNGAPIPQFAPRSIDVITNARPIFGAPVCTQNGTNQTVTIQAVDANPSTLGVTINGGASDLPMTPIGGNRFQFTGSFSAVNNATFVATDQFGATSTLNTNFPC